MTLRKATYKVGRLLSHHPRGRKPADFLWFHPQPRTAAEYADLSARINWYVGGRTVAVYAGGGVVPAFSPSDAPYMDPELVVDPGWVTDRPSGRAEHIYWRMSWRAAPGFLARCRRSEIADHTWYWLSDRGWTRVLERYGRIPAESGVAARALAALAKPGNEVLVLATGPSAQLVDLAATSADLKVTCNSAVRDKELMARLQPDVVCFADPVFHYGPSRYAAAFRADLCELVDDSDVLIATSDHFAAIMLAHRPDLADRTIILHPDPNSPWRVPGPDDNTVFQTGNVLTGLMLPVAASIGDTLDIAGCDGREPSETYFWKHNTKTQYSDEMMQSAFDTHPAFFRDVSYTDYYQKHCDELEEFAVCLESLGKKLSPITPSWIPALRRRGAPTLEDGDV